MQRTQNNTPIQRIEKGPTAPEMSAFVSLSADQLQDAVVEVASEIDDLVQASLDISGSAKALLADGTNINNAALEEQLEAIARPGGDMALRLQSFDRFYQRLSHVQDQLRLLSNLLDGQRPSDMDAEWSGFLEAVRQGFTMEAERQLFDAVYAQEAEYAATGSKQQIANDPVIF